MPVSAALRLERGWFRSPGGQGAGGGPANDTVIAAATPSRRTRQ
ncbi:hypothetical protein [Azospirillum cavernae]|nr:hypothetical protein [Azospirillum cavernae]